MSPSSSTPAQPPKLLDQLRNVMLRKHLSLATEEDYVGWCRRFLLFHDTKHPKDLGEVEIRALLTDWRSNGRSGRRSCRLIRGRRGGSFPAGIWRSPAVAARQMAAHPNSGVTWGKPPPA